MYLFLPPPHLATPPRRTFVLPPCGRFIRPIQLYHQSPVLMLQQLVDNWIMDMEGSTAATPPVVRVTEFPSPAYGSDGFWSQVKTRQVVYLRCFRMHYLLRARTRVPRNERERASEGRHMLKRGDTPAARDSRSRRFLSPCSHVHCAQV